MHNVKRVPQPTLSAEAIAEKRAEEQKKLDVYKKVEDTYLTFRAQQAFTPEALESTTSLLACNPEYYSAWNYRRDILLHMFEKETSAAPGEASLQTKLLEEDLSLLQQSMRTHPKVYWLWNHRRWCLMMLPPAGSDDQAKQAKWRKEIGLVDMMLEMDPRNFMGWNYRRWIIEELAKTMVPEGYETTPPFPSSLSSSLPTSVKEAHLALALNELKYTLRKIESNFSNFSAWHNRSKLLPCVWDAQQLDETQRRERREQEFELLQQAMYTDPSDQSVWIYHRWLVAQDPSEATLTEQIQVIEELLALEPDNKWCIESLAHYKQQLASQYQGCSEQAEACDRLTTEVHTLLSKLVQIDPLRQHRYQDLLRKSTHTH